jgi:two-component system response regulator RegX3
MIAVVAELAAVARALTDAGHAVRTVTNVGDAIDRVAVLVVANAESASFVRSRSATQAVLVVDAGARDDDPVERAERNVAARVKALAAGADDAMTLPAHTSQMVARVDALERRAALLPQTHDRVERDGCVLDLCALTATRDGVAHEITELEAKLVRWLAMHADRPVPREELLERVWGHSREMATRTVDMTVARLRKKIERDASAPRIIRSVKSVGYILGS